MDLVGERGGSRIDGERELEIRGAEEEESEKQIQELIEKRRGGQET